MAYAPLTRMSIALEVTTYDQAALVEELLWTLPTVESVTYLMDGETCFQGLQVIGRDPALPKQVEEALSTYLASGAVRLTQASSIQEQDWAESWKQHWHVARLLPNLVIQPSWEAFTPEPGDVVLHLDPGSAFGTGTHETTQLMLFLLDELLRKPVAQVQRLLDVGTGSGILGIYAAKLGVPVIIATDNDPHAVDVARSNVSQNGVSPQIQCVEASVSAVSQEAPFDVVVANILAVTLQNMMPELASAMASGAKLLLGGITRVQYHDMLPCIDAAGLVLRRVLQKGEWVALVCERRS